MAGSRWPSTVNAAPCVHAPRGTSQAAVAGAILRAPQQREAPPLNNTPPGTPDPRFDVGTALDTATIGRSHVAIALLAMSVIVLDGFDLQALAFAAPALLSEWGITRADLAPIFAAGMVGVAIGGLTIGPRGDVWGRRPALIGSAIFFGLTTLASAWAQTEAQLLILRLLAGVGMGGALTNATALVVETAPLRWRPALTMVTMVGVPVGGFIGGMLAARLIPAYGWESVFLVGGVMPVLLAIVLWIWLPESARFLLRANRRTEANAAVNALLGEERYAATDPLWLNEPPARKHLDTSQDTGDTIRCLIRMKKVTEIGPDLIVLSDAYDNMVRCIQATIKQQGPSTVSALRQELGVSRRIAIPLLEKLDKEGRTIREGDFRNWK